MPKVPSSLVYTNPDLSHDVDALLPDPEGRVDGDVLGAAVGGVEDHLEHQGHDKS